MVFEIVDGVAETLETYAEQNTADGAVLEEFATYALGLAEHDKVAFVIKSEGLSWRGIGRDNTPEIYDFVYSQFISDQLMSTGDLADALIAAQSETEKDIDLLVLEGSLMAFIEVVYELRDAAPILLATQSKIQPDGLPWAMVIEDLGATSDMTNKELGIAITDNHIEYYEDKGNNGVPNFDTSINFAAMTVFDLEYIDDVRAAHCHWAETTWPLFDQIYNLLPHARDLSDVGGYGEITDFDYQSDIKTFMVEGLRLIAEAGLDFPVLTDAVNDYLNKTYPEEDEEGKLIIYFQKPADGFKLRAANGLSIWYPPTWNKYETRDESDELFGSTMYYEDPDIGLDWAVIGPEWFNNEYYVDPPFIDTYGDGSNWTIYLFEYFDRADANLAGNGIGTEGDEPPKTGLFEKIDEVGGG